MRSHKIRGSGDENGGSSTAIRSNPSWRPFLLHGLLGRFRIVRLLKMADALGISGIRFIVIQISTSIGLGHGFTKASTLIFLLPMNFCFSTL